MRVYIILAALIITTASCNRPRCWKCTSQIPKGYAYTFYANCENGCEVKSEVCDKTKDEIRYMEMQNKNSNIITNCK